MPERLAVHPAAPSSAGRQRMPRLLALVAAMTLALLGVLGTPTAAAAFDEGTIDSLANQSRSSNGLGPLTLNASLSQVAAGWASQMAADGAISHNPAYSSQIAGGWTRAAENVAQGYPTGAAVHEGWMNSPGHRANILGDFTDIGIAHIAVGGTTWSVQVFAKYGSSVPAPQPAPAAAPPAAAPPAAALAPAPAPPAPEAPPAPSTSPQEEPVATPTPATGATPPVPADRDKRAEGRAGPGQDDPGDSEGPDASASGDLATKVSLGAAFVAALGAALAGWFRYIRGR